MDKLCKDCKYYKRQWPYFWRKDYARCLRDGRKIKFFHDGRTIAEVVPFAYLERQMDLGWTCGPEAKYFEPRETVLEREEV